MHVDLIFNVHFLLYNIINKRDKESKKMNTYNPYNPYFGANFGMGNNFSQSSQLNNLQTKQEITRVNGRNGAEAFLLAPNSSVLLLDETAPIVWLAQTDGARYKTVTPYKITPYQTEKTIDINTLENRVKKLEELINEKPNIERTTKSNTNGK